MSIPIHKAGHDQGALIRIFIYLLTGSLFLATVSVAQITTANIRLWQVFLFLILISSLVRGVVIRSSFKIKRNMMPPVWLVLFLFVNILISGIAPLDSSIWAKQLLLLSIMLILFFVMASNDDPKVFQKIQYIIILAGTATCLYALLEFFINPEDLQLYYSDGILLPRVRGPFAESNEFSQYITLPFAYTISCLAFGRSVRKIKVLLLTALIILLLGQWLSFSRGGILAFLVSTFVVLYFHLRESRIVQLARNLSISFIVVLFVIFAATGLDSEGVFIDVLLDRVLSLFSGSDQTTSIRYEGILKALSFQFGSFSDSLLGVGFGNLPFVLEPTVATTANFIIDIYVEAGFFAVTSILVFVSYLLYAAFAQLKKYAYHLPVALKTSYIGTLASFCGILSGGLTYATHMLNIFWFISGLLLAFILQNIKYKYFSSGKA